MPIRNHVIALLAAAGLLVLSCGGGQSAPTDAASADLPITDLAAGDLRPGTDGAPVPDVVRPPDGDPDVGATDAPADQVVPLDSPAPDQPPLADLPVPPDQTPAPDQTPPPDQTPAPDQSVSPDGGTPGSPCGPGEWLCGSACCPWTDESVDVYLESGDQCSIAIDSQKGPHIAYMQKWSTWQALMYTHRTATSWPKSTVSASSPGDWSHPSIAITGSDVPSIAYNDHVTHRLGRATRVGPTWTSSYVFPSPAVQYGHSALRFTSQDAPRIAYYGQSAVYLAIWGPNPVSPSWSASYIGPAKQDKVPLALDVNDNAHVVYQHATGLGHARWNGAQWIKSVVDPSISFNAMPSVALDAAGHPWVSYYDVNQSKLRIAHNPGSGWQIQSLPGTATSFNNSTVALDSAGKIHVAYHGARGTSAPSGLIHALHDGTQWVLELVTAGAGWSNLALDSAGTPHLCYQDNQLDLRYATH